MELLQQISNRIQQLMQEQNLLQKEVAYRAEMDAASFNRIIKAKANITINTINRLEKVFGKPILTVTHE